MMKYRTWMKRICVIAIAGCMTLSGMPLTTYAEPTGTEPEEVEDVEVSEDAIYLSNADDIVALAENCVDDNWSVDKVVVLNNDIDMTDVEFTGIPTFGGVFIGQGYTISGIHMEQDMTVMGFFRYLQKTAVVDNVRLEAIVESDGSNNQIGGFVGINRGKIQNCTFVGLVSGTEQIGGIVGWNKTSGIIVNCEVEGVVHGDRYIGGIVGQNQGVIRCCTNNAEVNTTVDQNSIPMDLSESLSFEMELSLDMDMSSFETQSTDYASDIGGIAGTSSGVIRECVNNENVGYNKMGYNIGGIVGSQNGYVVDCINYAQINGMDGVGGIVGYFKPNVVLEFGPNPMDTMSAQMNNMMSSMKDVMNDMQNMSFSTVDIGSIEDALGVLENPDLGSASDIEDILGEFEGGFEGELDESFDFDIDVNEDSINAALNDLSNSFGNIYNGSSENESSSILGDMSGSMDDMMSAMEGMMSSMESIGSMNMSMEFDIVDISRTDTESDTIAKVANCANYGEVLGNTYIAGIVGLADMEMTSLMEAMGEESQMSTSGEMVVRLVVRDCRNYANISAAKKYAGGIVGEMVYGAVINGMNTGNLDALNANYVGGIAGSCESIIMDSYSRSIIAGGDYVGGIAGYGIEVIDSYACSDIVAYNKWAGGILGNTEDLPNEVEGLVQGAYYYLAGKDLGAIDGINYDGATERITLDEYLALENLDDMFKTVKVTFVVEGQEDIVLEIGMGESVALSEVPLVEVDTSDRYDWEYIKPVTSETLAMNETEEVYYLSEARLSNILFDQTYEAVVDAKYMVSEGEYKTSENHNIILAVGAFDKETSVKLTDMLQAEPIVNEVSVRENWLVEISNIGVEKLHYRIPEGLDTEHLKLYVKDATGQWVEREFMIEGSFMIFEFHDGETGFALEETQSVEIYVIGIVVIIVVVLLFLIIRKRKQNVVKKKKED